MTGRLGLLAGIGCVLAAFGAPGGSAGAPGAPAAHAEGPLPGHTGGFGEPTCQACHAEFQLNLDGRLTVEGLPDAWEPGRAYRVTLRLDSEGMERAGFQAALRWTSGKAAGRPAGTPTPAGDGVVLRPSDDGSLYLQHAPGGTWTAGATTVTWSFLWTVPERPGGAVAFHAAANSANGDNSPFGDIVYTVTDTVAGPLSPP